MGVKHNKKNSPEKIKNKRLFFLTVFTEIYYETFFVWDEVKKIFLRKVFLNLWNEVFTPFLHTGKKLPPEKKVSFPVSHDERKCFSSLEFFFSLCQRLQKHLFIYLFLTIICFHPVLHGKVKIPPWDFYFTWENSPGKKKEFSKKNLPVSNITKYKNIMFFLKVVFTQFHM